MSKKAPHRGAPPKVAKPQTKTVHLDRQVSEVVRKEMEKQNISWNELVKRSGLSRSSVARILRSNAEKQRIETLEQLAEALGIKPSAFWTVEVSPSAR